MEDWKKSEGTFNLACDPQRASGMMQNTCVKIEHVTKRFGEDIVLQEVNLSLKTGNVYGIVGNNGSGKTVLMKCICGFLPVTTGTIFVFGKKIGHDVDFPESLGVIIETPGFLTQYTGFKNLEILARLSLLFLWIMKIRKQRQLPVQNYCLFRSSNRFVLSWKLQIFHLFYTLWIQ